MFIGMRIIKTALAVTISALLAIWLNLDSPFFAVIAAIITMQGNLADSFIMAKDRILGTAIGGAVGVLGAYLAHGNPLILGVGVGLIIFAANKLRWHRAISIATIVFGSIMLGNSGDTALMSSVHRVIDTMVGITVAVTVNYSISRPLSRDRVLKSARDLVIKYKTVLGMLICHEEGVTLTDISKQVQIIEHELPGVKAELRMHILRANDDIDFDAIKAKIDALYRHISLLAALECPGRLNQQNTKMVNALYSVNLIPGMGQGEVDIVYNYHLERSLTTLHDLFHTLMVEHDDSI